MGADAQRPRFDLLVESLAVACRQCPRRFLESGAIAGHGQHEPVGRLLRLPDTFLALVRTFGLVDKLAQGNRGASWLPAEPIPMSRQQGDFAGDHAKPRPAGATGGRVFAFGSV